MKGLFLGVVVLLLALFALAYAVSHIDTRPEIVQLSSADGSKSYYSSPKTAALPSSAAASKEAAKKEKKTDKQKQREAAAAKPLVAELAPPQAAKPPAATSVPLRTADATMTASGGSKTLANPCAETGVTHATNASGCGKTKGTKQQTEIAGGIQVKEPRKVLARYNTGGSSPKSTTSREVYGEKWNMFVPENPLPTEQPELQLSLYVLEGLSHLFRVKQEHFTALKTILLIESRGKGAIRNQEGSNAFGLLQIMPEHQGLNGFSRDDRIGNVSIALLLFKENGYSDWAADKRSEARWGPVVRNIPGYNGSRDEIKAWTCQGLLSQYPELKKLTECVPVRKTIK